jgi:hypothetical protein
MADNWSFNIKHVNPGEPVEAGVVGRPDRALADRTAYLKDRLDAAEAGKAIIDLGATIASNVLPGNAVYWNADRQQYELALASFSADPDTGAFVLTPAAQCVGICYQKMAENRGDIALQGLVRFKNLESSIGQNVEAGKYFLSAVSPGKLSKQNPPITAPVCYVLGRRDNCSTDVYVLVCPQIKDSLDEHVHFRIDLATVAAGNPVVSDGRATIAAPDVTVAGWLPADHASFNNKAPAGAKFGYNIPAHKALSRLWPPVPTSSATLLRDKGAGVGATELHVSENGVAIIDINGIWWLDDCAENVPWTNAGNEEDEDTCPRPEQMRVVFIGTRMLVGNVGRFVTSLQANENSPVVVIGCSSDSSTTGDLKVDANYRVQDCPPLTIEDHELGPDQGGKIFATTKSIDDLVALYETAPETFGTDDVVAAAAEKENGRVLNTNKNYLCKSWVTEGVVAHGLNQLTVSSTWERPLTNAEKIYLQFVDTSGDPLADTIKAHQGLIKLDFDSAASDRELSPQIVRLDDAIERIYNDIPYLAFPPGQDSAIRVRLNVPFVNTLGGANLRMKIRALVFRPVGASSPSGIGRLFMSYRVIPSATQNLEYLPIPMSDVVDDNNFPSNLVAPKDNVVTADSVSFAVSRGDTVLVTFSRASDDATAGDIGILRIAGILFNQPVE